MKSHQAMYLLQIVIFSPLFLYFADCFSEETLKVLTQAWEHSRKVIYNSKSVLNMLLFSCYLEIYTLTNSP